MTETHLHSRTTTKELPPDIIHFHILPRLPAKTVVRFTTVSKDWRSYLNTRLFRSLHHRHTITSDDHKLLLVSVETPFKILSLDCESPDKCSSLTLPFEVDYYMNMSILTSCNGMVCVGMKKASYNREFDDLLLWNPVTVEYKTLSKTNSHVECYHDESPKLGFMLYYDCFVDDYKLLFVTKSGYAYIYSLKSDSWKRVETGARLYRWESSVFSNGNVYFLNQYRRKVWITRLDIKSETFTKVTTPSFRRIKPEWRNFTVENNCIQLRVRNDFDGSIELWTMNDRVSGDLKKVETYMPKPYLNRHMAQLHLMRDGNRLMWFGGYVYKFNWEMYLNGGKGDQLTEEGMIVYEEGKYVESFVSPNQNL